MLKNTQSFNHTAQENKYFSDSQLYTYSAHYPNIMQSMCFRIQTFEEARRLAAKLSQYYPNPNQAETGLNELLINAIEHGNLNISFEEKQKILQDNAWINTVYERLFLIKNKQKKVIVKFEKTPGCITTHIKDQGEGFAWKKFLNRQPDFSANGRGIFIAQNFAFDSLEYIDNGSHVISRTFY